VASGSFCASARAPKKQKQHAKVNVWLSRLIRVFRRALSAISPRGVIRDAFKLFTASQVLAAVRMPNTFN
jgi:hypothetical protein